MADTLEGLQKQVEYLRTLKEKVLAMKTMFDSLTKKTSVQRSFEPATAIIVEPRKHRALSFVLKNALENLDPNWNVRIYHGTKNKEFVEDLLNKDLAFGRSRITLMDIGMPNLDEPHAYSRFMTDRNFLESIPTEIYLIFQTDSMINPSNKDLVHEFMQYDYVGAPWSTGLVGNGGFSLRRRSKMLEIVESLPYTTGNEDMYFALNAKLKGLDVPPTETALRFSIETIISPEFFGLHRVWCYNPQHLLDLCVRCPGLTDLVALQDVVDDGDRCTAIIVEPRKHRALSFVVKNILENLGPEWDVRIYHGTQNKEFVEDLLETDLAFGRSRITLENLKVDNLPTPFAYSGILSSREFTEKIPTETFIVFQTDSMINPNNRDLLQKFMKYDYVGAPWPWEHLKVGNGGFSLRKRSKMLHIINTTPRCRTPYEDQYFSVGSLMARPFIPMREEAMEFSIEQVYSPRSFAIHNAWKYLPDHVEQMCKDCPGLATLISLQSEEGSK